jgi:hypothetical protein
MIDSPIARALINLERLPVPFSLIFHSWFSEPLMIANKVVALNSRKMKPTKVIIGFTGICWRFWEISSIWWALLYPNT